MKILLMGGSGWLGHNIALQLADYGVDFAILTRGKKRDFANDVSDFPMICADKSDENAMREVFAKERFTHIIDTVPTLKSIEIVKKYATGLHHYVHCSSTGGYAPLPFVPANETAPYRGFRPGCGWDNKRLCDQLVIESFMKEGFPGTVIRPCYITGVGKLPLDNIGGRREDFMRDIAQGKPLDLPDDGQSLLQPIHVEDLAASFLLALDNPRIAIGQIYNICLAYALPLNRYLELNAAAIGKKPVINYMSVEDIVNKYKVDPNFDEIGLRFLATHMCFSIDKAVRDLGFQPHCTPEDAVEETAYWAAKTTGAI